MNLDGGEVLFEQDADAQVEVASLTKIMTVYLAAEAVESGKMDLEDTVTITAEMVRVDPAFVKAGLYVGQKITVEDLLYLTLLPSNADAAQALAVTVGGSVKDFVAMMNATAQEWGMDDTHFSNVVGYDLADEDGYISEDGEKNHSTARDVATMVKRAIENPTFETVFGAREYITADGTKLNSTTQTTAQRFGINTEMITGVKTGFTNAAGRCLASTAELEASDVLGESGASGLEGSGASGASELRPNLLAVTLGAATTDGHVRDTTNLYNYFADNYSYRLASEAILSETKPLVAYVGFENASVETVEVYEVGDATYYYLDNAAETKVQFVAGNNITLAEGVEVPVYKYNFTGDFGFSFAKTIPASEQIGVIKYTADEKVLNEVGVTLGRDVTIYNYPMIFGTIGAGVVAVAAIIGLIVRTRRRKTLTP